MKIIVTHSSPDWDAIGSVWVIKRLLPGWTDADVQFIPAGQLLEKCKGFNSMDKNNPIEIVGSSSKFLFRT